MGALADSAQIAHEMQDFYMDIDVEASAVTLPESEVAADTESAKLKVQQGAAKGKASFVGAVESIQLSGEAVHLTKNTKTANTSTKPSQIGKNLAC